MQFLLDHIIVIIIAAVIFLIIQSIQFLRMETGLEEVASYESKQNSLDLAEIIEKDFNSTLNRFDDAAAPFTWPVNAGGLTTQISFYRDSLSSAPVTVLPLQTRYDLTFADSIQTPDGAVAVYQLERFECTHETSPCTWHPTGVSASLLTDFDVLPLRADKTPAANVAESYYLDISFTMIPPFRTSRQVVHNIYWNTVMQIQPY